MLHTLHFFYSSKCRLFHNATFFDSCIIRILHTRCAKILMTNSGSKRLICGIGNISSSLHQYNGTDSSRELVHPGRTDKINKLRMHILES
jgi:hypothetical protein